MDQIQSQIWLVYEGRYWFYRASMADNQQPPQTNHHPSCPPMGSVQQSLSFEAEEDAGTVFMCQISS